MEAESFVRACVNHPFPKLTNNRRLNGVIASAHLFKHLFSSVIYVKGHLLSRVSIFYFHFFVGENKSKTRWFY